MELRPDVVQAAVDGDLSAQEQLYREYAPRIQAYFLARGVDDAEGLTADVFVQVLAKLSGFVGGPMGLRSFIFTVAHARYVDRVRRRRREPRLVALDDWEDAGMIEAAEEVSLSEAANVVELLRRLPEDQREVVALRVIGDLSLEETAKVMRRSVGAVKQLQRRGLLALRNELEGGEAS